MADFSIKDNSVYYCIKIHINMWSFENNLELRVLFSGMWRCVSDECPFSSFTEKHWYLKVYP